MVAAAAALGLFAAATGILIRLHFLATGRKPVRDAVSDYGTTKFHRNYRVMVVLLGAGAILLAVALARETDARALAWLWIYGVSRVAIAAFMTDRDPPPVTTEGRVHWLLAAIAFTSIAFAATSIDWDGRSSILGPLGTAVAIAAVATLLTRMLPPLRPVFGLIERLLYAAGIAWLVLAAVDVAFS